MRQKRKILIGCILICCIAVMVAPRVHAATKTSAAGIVTTQSTGLNVRAEASSKSSRLTVLPKGSYVTLLNRTGEWWYVEYAKGKYGYCAAQYITEDTGSIAGSVNTAQTGLNVRSGPGTRYSVDAVLAKGTFFVILSEANGWSRILYNGVKTGYASSTYIKSYENTYGSIALRVPYYQQTDSRWSWYPLGTQGSTIRSAGCLVTSLAMIESYRTGTTITPDVQASGMNFTAGGAAYWPSHYERAYISERGACLEKIYQVLQSGRPVVVGSKNSAGGQHWVVVTGYTGSGSTLSASSFTILDPGTSSRTTLAAHFAAYPIIYCQAYYKL